MANHQRLLAAIPPEQREAVTVWMLPALSPGERAFLKAA